MKTHLRLYNRNLTSVADVVDRHNFDEIKQLYIHSNKLVSAIGITVLKNLTHLYMQWNSITTIKDLNDLPILEKLYLGFNCINVLEGLQGMPKLKVLHIQNQRFLQEQSTFICNHNTIKSLTTVREINISGNGITSIFWLKDLKLLEYLDISNNLVSNLQETCINLYELTNLREVKIFDNPFTKNPTYMEKLISACNSLGVINEKNVSKLTKKFITDLSSVVNENQKRRQTEKAKFSSETQKLLCHLPDEFRKIVSQSTIHQRQNRRYKHSNF